MVGFLLLCGVVVNNGIVFVDCINQLRIGGMAKREAIIETGRMRLRPILMTAMTTVLGMSTMALGTGMGAEMMQPMAVVSIGGLIYATIMTLFVVPILYDLLNGEKMKAREIEMIREAAGLRNDAELLGEAQAAPASPAGDSSAQAAGGQEAFPPPAQAPRPDAALTEAPQPEAPVPDVQPEAPQPEAPVSDAQPEAPQPEAPVPDAQPEGDKANAGKKKKKKGDDKDKKKKRKQKKRDED